MAEKKKILEPFIQEKPDIAKDGFILLEEGHRKEERISGVLIRDITAEAEDFSHIEVSAVIFENCRFWNCSFERADLRDVVFKSCDLSGCDLSDAYMNRVAFLSCKGVGTKFTGNTLLHVTVRDSNLNYANFDASKLEHVLFSKTELNSSNITQCKCKAVYWDHVNLVNASFFKTPLRGMDLSDSTITGLVLSDDNTELKGAVVDMYQAAELAGRLGITIKSR